MKCRRRKTVRWTLTVLAVLTLVTWAGSCWCYVESWWKWGKNDVIVYLQFGRISIEIEDMDLDSGPDGLVGFYSACDSDPEIFWWFDYQESGGIHP